MSSSSKSVDHSQLDEDAQHLARLGYTYETEFKREMSFWGNVSLGFTYLSPVVGVYTLFASSLGLGGPPMIWSFLIVGVGQFFVALVFGEIVSNYPVAGGIYPWARRLWGAKWGWMTGWVYLIALLTTIAGVAYGAGTFLDALIGIDPSTTSTIVCAIVLILAATGINLGGTKLLNKVAMLGLLAELGGALVVGLWLLVVARKHDLSVLFNSFGAGGDGSNYFYAFAAAALIGIYQYYGFEACGDVAEEVPNPGVRIPKAMRMTIYIGGFAATFVCLSLILAVPDYAAVISGQNTDPVGTVLTDAFSPIGYRVVLAVVLISFLSCVMSLQAAASRLSYSMARDKMLPASRLLAKFQESRHVPPYSLLLACVVPVLVILGSAVSPDALVVIVSFAAFGIYLGFQLVVFAALRARLNGWKPSGAFKLGKWGVPVNIAALTWGLIGITNMVWPRTPDSPWYVNYLVLLSAVVVVGSGFIYLFARKPYTHSDSPAADAIPSARTAGEYEPSKIENYL
ncbi:APC family permease [Arthrobacter bambusae]|uniref:APC family permease n=1 Tax=Arthrobacter bambusae TaxID=1338426 RepID=UPI00277DF81C|nr:APC family permease [Arthrobacter bambusae]MDQ0029921.1 amino acid transporter [Arthrobacter bambusae]MDQ0097561.1 amino acid transporter [Arthrobacter bambusae]